MPLKFLRAHPRLPVVQIALLGFLLAGNVRSVFAQATNVTLLGSDALGASSFVDATNWNNGLAPFSGNGLFTNAYFTTNFTLRTPADAGSYIFAGDSLEVDTNGGALGIKGVGTITVSNLILNFGRVANSGTGGNPDTATLAGNITLVANSILDGGGTNGLTTLNVLAPISGSAGITIQNNGAVMFSTNNTYAGNTTVSTNSTLKMGITNAIPNGPGNGFVTLSGGTPSGAVLDLNGFDTTANDITSGGGVAPAQIINSAVGKTNTLTVDLEFLTGKTFKALIKDNNGTGGAIALNIIGSTFWTIVSNLTYSGDTTINGGRLAMGASGNILPWGSGKGNLIVNSPGILDLQGRSEQINGLSGNGTIDNFSGNGLAAGGRSTLNCGSNDVSSVFSGIIQNQFYDAAIDPTKDSVSLVKFGAGTLTLTGINTFNGNVTINAGGLRITSQNGDGVTGGGLGIGSQTTPPTKTISITSATGDASLYLDATNDPIVVDSTLAFQTAGTNGAIVNEAGDNIINGPISLRTGSATTIRVDGGTLNLAGNLNLLANATSRTLTLGGAANGTVNGAISDGSPATNILSLTKAGVGTWTLAGDNIYSDVTTINGGSLILGAAASIAITPTIDVQTGGNFNVAAVNGGWSLGASQTLRGSGTVTGNVTANGTVSPGESIGTLTFASQLMLAGTTLMELNRTNLPANADAIFAGTLAFGGTLTVSNIGPALQAGDSFSLFVGPSSGHFSATNLPALTTTNLFWDTSRLASQGIISVGGPQSAPHPTIQPVTVTGTNLNIQFASTSGFYYFLESATNLAAPVWVPLQTNLGGGTIQLQVPIIPAKPGQFFRVRASAP